MSVESLTNTNATHSSSVPETEAFDVPIIEAPLVKLAMDSTSKLSSLQSPLPTNVNLIGASNGSLFTAANVRSERKNTSEPINMQHATAVLVMSNRERFEKEEILRANGNLTEDLSNELDGDRKSPIMAFLKRSNTTGSSPKPPKHLQFNLAMSKNTLNTPNAAITSIQPDSLSKNNKHIFSSISKQVRENLSQMKADAIKKRQQKKTEEAWSTHRKYASLKSWWSKVCVKVSYRQKQMFYLLERPVGKSGCFYRLLTLSVILLSILSGSLTTFHTLDTHSITAFFWCEIAATLYFAVELLLRVWSCGHQFRYSGVMGRLRFMAKPMHLIEFTTMTASVSLLVYGARMHRYTVTLDDYILHALRFVQICRFLYVDRQGSSWTLLIKVIIKHRFELLTSIYIGMIILLFSSFFILIFEKPYSEAVEDTHFHTFSDAIYWSIITMTTIGYGDRSPRTFPGKVVATGLCIVGVAFWTLPGGIIGSGFAFKVEQRNKKKQLHRLLPAAASLIQAWWRMKATSNLSLAHASQLIATVNTFNISKPIRPTVGLRRLKTEIDASIIKHDAIFTGLDAQQTPNDKTRDAEGDGTIADNVFEPFITKATTPQQKQDTYATFSSMLTQDSTSNDMSMVLIRLSPEHLILIRIILILKYFSAKTRFKMALKPYNFKDVIEQYNQGNMDILKKMKELQRKMEVIPMATPISVMRTGSVFESTMLKRTASPLPLSLVQQRQSAATFMPLTNKQDNSSQSSSGVPLTPLHAPTQGLTLPFFPSSPQSHHSHSPVQDTQATLKQLPSTQTNTSSPSQFFSMRTRSHNRKGILMAATSNQQAESQTPTTFDVPSTPTPIVTSTNEERFSRFENELATLAKKIDMLIELGLSKQPESMINTNTGNKHNGDGSDQSEDSSSKLMLSVDTK